MGTHRICSTWMFIHIMYYVNAYAVEPENCDKTSSVLSKIYCAISSQDQPKENPHQRTLVREMLRNSSTEVVDILSVKFSTSSTYLVSDLL